MQGHKMNTEQNQGEWYSPELHLLHTGNVFLSASLTITFFFGVLLHPAQQLIIQILRKQQKGFYIILTSIVHLKVLYGKLQHSNKCWVHNIRASQSTNSSYQTDSIIQQFIKFLEKNSSTTRQVAKCRIAKSCIKFNLQNLPAVSCKPFSFS